ncbi:hypothetical protein FRB90_009603, partial [Tulasnella sp. 427]
MAGCPSYQVSVSPPPELFKAPPPPPPLFKAPPPPPPLNLITKSGAAPSVPSPPAVEARPVVPELVKENKPNVLLPANQEEETGAGRANLRRAGAVIANAAPPRPLSDSIEYEIQADMPGNLAPGYGGSGFRQPEGGYELRGPRQPDTQTHLRRRSEGQAVPSMNQLRPPSSLLNPVDLPPSMVPGTNPRRDQLPAPNQYLSAPPSATAMPNGTGNARSRTPSPVRSRPQSTSGTRPVMISETHGDPRFGLSNLSYTPLNYPDPDTAVDKQYPTPEHLFQAMKFMGHRPLLAEHIRMCGPNPKPRDEAKRFAYQQDPTWSTICTDKMYEVLKIKFHTYPGLETELLDTGEADLIL